MSQSSDYTQDPICRICGAPYAGHPRCQCCGIFCGPKHFREGVSRYRGKRLCTMCIEEWESMEKRVGHEVLWKVFSDRSNYYRPDGQLKRNGGERGAHEAGVHQRQ